MELQRTFTTTNKSDLQSFVGFSIPDLPLIFNNATITNADTGEIIIFNRNNGKLTYTVKYIPNKIERVNWLSIRHLVNLKSNFTFHIGFAPGK